MSPSAVPAAPLPAPEDVCDVIQGRSFPRTEVVHCPLCARHHRPRVLRAGMGMHAVVAECRPCRIAYQSHRPSLAASIAYMDWRWASRDAYVADPEFGARRARFQLDLVRQQRGPTTLLDFGAGTGTFVRTATDAGYAATGIEHSPVARAEARKRHGVPLVEEAGDDYDVVTLWDVIEHLRDPIGTLAELRRRMRPDGLLFVETGNWESWSRFVQGDAWGLYLFDHQYYFSPRSLVATLRKAGFRDARLRNPHHARPWWAKDRWSYRLTAPWRTILLVSARAS
ncbi:MAG: class I SAM-dependent methyltransferase [Planctomycetaceae bacterium]